MNRHIEPVHRWLPLVAAVLVASCGDAPAPPADDAGMLVLYTSLPAERADRIASAYKEATGTVVNYMLESEPVLIEKMVQKEHYPGADVLLISGAGHVAGAVDEDVLRPLRSPALEEALDAAYRDPDGFWFGTGVRAEVIAFDQRAVDPAELTGYAALGDQRWLGKLCLQRSVAERSRSLIATMIARQGTRDAELAVRGWRANLATSVFDTQRELLQAIEAGDCALGVVSSDAVARFMAGEKAEHLGVHFPAAAAGGVTLGLTAAGVSRHANDPAAAQRFVEWLVSPIGQAALHGLGYEFPVIEVHSLDMPRDGWRGFAVSPVHTARAGLLYQDAVLLAERARYR